MVSEGGREPRHAPRGPADGAAAWRTPGEPPKANRPAPQPAHRVTSKWLARLARPAGSRAHSRQFLGSDKVFLVEIYRIFVRFRSIEVNAAGGLLPRTASYSTPGSALYRLTCLLVVSITVIISR